MKIISFAFTTPALLSGAKTVTRRDWTEKYAAMFHAGDLVQAYDKSPRNHGKRVALIRLTVEPVRETPNLAPDADYEAEGFAWLEAHPEHLPSSGHLAYLETVSRHGYDEWRAIHWDPIYDPLWVVRFALIEVCGEQPARSMGGEVGA